MLFGGTSKLLQLGKQRQLPQNGLDLTCDEQVQESVPETRLSENSEHLIKVT